MRMLAALVLIATPAFADAPPAPAPMTVCALDDRSCATRDPARGTTLVWRREGRTRRPLWRAPTAGTNLQLADGGMALVDFYPGANLLDADAGPTTPMLTFHRPGRPPVSFRLGQLIARPAALPRTTSHRQWVQSYGFDARWFVLNTVEGRRFAFDPLTARPVKGALVR